jgi:hypothetical protein
MKVAPRLPDTLRIINRESFLTAVEKRGQVLLRARTQAPGTHLLALYTDNAERYVVIEDIGPQAKHHDVRHALAHGPAELQLTYLVPTVECPPYAMPANLPQTELPASLAPLTPPPAGFHAEPATAKTGAHAVLPTMEALLPPGRADSKSPFGFALEKKGIRLPAPEDRLLQQEIALRHERAAFEEDCARRLMEFESRENTLQQRDNELLRRENDLTAKSAALLDLLGRIDLLRRHLLDPSKNA